MKCLLFLVVFCCTLVSKITTQQQLPVDFYDDEGELPRSPRRERDLFDVGLCVSPTATCQALSECRLVSELMDRQCLAAGRLRDMTCGYSNATKQPLVCCPSKETGVSKPAPTEPKDPDYETGGSSSPGDYSGEAAGEGSNTPSGPGALLPTTAVCGMPQLIVGTPPRAPLQAGPTRLGAHPWLARIGFKNLATGATEFACSGSIIGEKTILTAAHCINARGSGFKLTTVRVGEYDTATDPDCSTSMCAFPVKDIPINKAVVHPNYDDSTFRNDIGIITLKTALNFSMNVQPVCLLTRFSAVLVGRRALVVGWGRIFSQTKALTVQQALEVPIIQLERCTRFFTSSSAASLDQKLCAGGEQGRDLCTGFSGAPLLVRASGVGAFFQVGIRAFGSDQCGANGAANVFTNVGRHTAFIRNNIAS